jgi:LPS sulfotransferase NodH
LLSRFDGGTLPFEASELLLERSDQLLQFASQLLQFTDTLGEFLFVHVRSHRSVTLALAHPVSVQPDNLRMLA